MKWQSLARFVWPASGALCCLLLVILCVKLADGSRTVQHTPVKKQAAPKEQPPSWTFPGGGTQLFPQHRVVALYGTPGAPTLGALGEQSTGDSIARIKSIAHEYQALSTEPIVPAFEIITTIASSAPTSNNDYSREIDPASIQPWIDAARQAGVYVVLDLQPGRTDFLTQAKQYESLLAQPNVGLALDPEWRLGPDQRPLVQIGSAGIDEVNQTAKWLAQVADTYHSPQKLFLVHQFRLSMLPDRQALDISHSELSYAIQMDGQGLQQTKHTTWSAVTANPPENMHFGWKNFYQKDSPMLTPQETMQVTPKPWYVSYQ